MDKIIKPWIKGAEEVLIEKYGKKFIRRSFFNPKTAAEEEYFLFGHQDWVVIMPVTKDNQVITVQQYKQGCDCVCIELPAGTIDKNDGDVESTAKRELLEETGYETQEMFSLGKPQFMSSRSSWTRFHMFLGLNCIKRAEINEDSGEILSCQLIDFEKWLRLCNEELTEPSAIVATFRSLKYLGYSVGR